MVCSTLHIERPKTKIICTLGPATSSEKMVSALVEAGMSVARLNMSHGTVAEHSAAIELVRGVSGRLGVPVGIMVDVPGAKYRTGPLSTGTLELSPGYRITLTSRDVGGDRDVVAVSPPGIHRDALVGASLPLDDGLMELRVLHVKDEDVVCTVVRGGRLTERRGVAPPGRSPSQPFLGERARKALDFAAEHHADFVALSMVTRAEDVATAREALQARGLDACIISKIERKEALDQFDRILESSDAIMVARGDMGVEVPLSRVPVIQKDLIARSNHAISDQRYET